MRLFMDFVIVLCFILGHSSIMVEVMRFPCDLKIPDSQYVDDPF